MKIAATLPALLPTLLLAACSTQPSAAADEAAEFTPPTVQMRGDLMARQERRFDRLDADGNGSLAASEFPKRRPERTAALDADKNGAVSKSEFVEGALQRFDAADGDKNGQVTPAERSAAGDR